MKEANRSAFKTTFFSRTPATVTTILRAHGIDYSKYDLQFHPETTTGQLDFGVQRISYWLTRDEAFETLLPGTLQLPVRGGYHYLASGVGWRDQVNAFVSYTNGLSFHFFVCDFEGYFNTLSLDFAYSTWRWIQEVQQRTGKKTILYTGRYLYQDWLVPSQARYGIDWNMIDLWEAEYPFSPNPATGNPTQPVGRTVPWTLWQYTDKLNGTQYGLGRSTAGDGDVFNGTKEELWDWCGAGIPPVEPPPPNGGNMETHVGDINQALNSRTGPGTSYSLKNPTTGVLQDGDKVYGVYDPTTRWIHYARIVRANGTQETWDAWASAASTNYMTVSDYTPPPSGDTAVTVKVTLRDGVATEVNVDGQAWVKPT